jgi:hypothetical protein
VQVHPLKRSPWASGCCFCLGHLCCLCYFSCCRLGYLLHLLLWNTLINVCFGSLSLHPPPPKHISLKLLLCLVSALSAVVSQLISHNGPYRLLNREADLVPPNIMIWLLVLLLVLLLLLLLLLLQLSLTLCLSCCTCGTSLPPADCLLKNAPSSSCSTKCAECRNKNVQAFHMSTRQQSVSGPKEHMRDTAKPTC